MNTKFNIIILTSQVAQSRNMSISEHRHCCITFKIFRRFWSAKITHIIHHNQLLLTKFERILPYWTDDVKSAAKLPITESLTEKTWRRRWVVMVASENKNGGTFHSFHQQKEIGELLAKNIARTARRQLEGRHLLFGEYLRNWTTLYPLNLPIKVDYRWR